MSWFVRKHVFEKQLWIAFPSTAANQSQITNRRAAAMLLHVPLCLKLTGDPRSPAEADRVRFRCTRSRGHAQELKSAGRGGICSV